MRALAFVCFGVAIIACGGSDEDNGSSSSSGGGTSTLGSGVCATAGSDPTSAATVGGFLDTLGSAGPQGDLRPKIIDAILRACDAFGPTSSSNSRWQRKYCWAHLASEILKESSYRPTSVVNDSYSSRTVGGSKANDPTVGLMQIRFSSVVHNYAAQGSLEQLSCAGCKLPSDLDAHKSESGDSSFWATGGGSHLDFLQDVSCNVALGAWYIYLNATGNGSSKTATFLDGYCKGNGVAGNLITGFRSFVNGPSSGKGIISDQAGFEALEGSDGNVYKYITAIKGSFDGMITPSPDPHPFFLELKPTPSQFCR